MAIEHSKATGAAKRAPMLSARIAAAVALVSLATLAVTEPASAGSTVAVTGPTIVLGTGGQPNEFTYSITNNTVSAITQIEIPEFSAGDIIVESSGSSVLAETASGSPSTDITVCICLGSTPGLPAGWIEGAESSPALFSSGGGFKSGTPGSYFDIEGGSLASGATASFGVFSFLSSTTLEDMAFDVAGSTVTVDPPIPSQGTPEPATLGLLISGLAGLAGLRRRR